MRYLNLSEISSRDIFSVGEGVRWTAGEVLIAAGVSEERALLL